MLELAQVERQRSTRQFEFFANLSDCHAGITGLDEQPKDIEPGFLSEGGKRRDGVYFLHISIYMEIKAYVNLGRFAKITPLKCDEQGQHQRRTSSW
jgi:hypothetical protein